MDLIEDFVRCVPFEVVLEALAAAADLSELQAVKHVNGFFSMHLAGCLPLPVGWNARVNFWNRAEPRAFDLHTHRWPAVSRVLVGSVCNRVFRHDDSGKAFEHYVHRPDEGFGQFSLARSGRSRLCLAAESALSAGDSYRLDPDDIHETECVSRRAATLMLTGPDFRRETDVYCRRRHGARTHTVIGRGEILRAVRWLSEQDSA